MGGGERIIGENLMKGEILASMRIFSLLFFRRKEAKESRLLKLWLNSLRKNRAKTKPPLCSGQRGLRGFLPHEGPARVFPRGIPLRELFSL
jgi:hypothetical protein